MESCRHAGRQKDRHLSLRPSLGWLPQPRHVRWAGRLIGSVTCAVHCVVMVNECVLLPPCQSVTPRTRTYVNEDLPHPTRHVSLQSQRRWDCTVCLSGVGQTSFIQWSCIMLANGSRRPGSWSVLLLFLRGQHTHRDRQTDRQTESHTRQREHATINQINTSSEDRIMHTLHLACFVLDSRQTVSVESAHTVAMQSTQIHIHMHTHTTHTYAPTCMDTSIDQWICIYFPAPLFVHSYRQPTNGVPPSSPPCTHTQTDRDREETKRSPHHTTPDQTDRQTDRGRHTGEKNTSHEREPAHTHTYLHGIISSVCVCETALHTA